MEDTNKTNHSPNKDEYPKKLFRSGGVAAVYDKQTLTAVFSNQLEVNIFYEEIKQKFEDLGLRWEDKLFLKFDDKNNPVYLDNVNTYILNSDGYRSKEFDGSAKILFAGCSNTFGTGVPETAIWGSVVANYFDKSSANISRQGASSQWIVKNIFAYFEEHGHPEVLCCLFPDLTRMTLAANNHQLMYRGNGSSGGKDIISDDLSRIYHIHLDNVLPPELSPDYSKRPHDIVDVIPADAAIFASMQSILLLDQYCRSHGIKFAWGTWDVSAQAFLSKIKDIYPRNYENLVDLDLDCWTINPDRETSGEVFLGKHIRSGLAGERPVVECHKDLIDKYQTNFYRGMDDLNGIDYAHPGAHQHAHIAEAFIEFLENS